MVCICIPTFNSATTLGQTLDSLIGQTYQDFEIMVVDNASTDGTVSVAQFYAERDARVKVLVHEHNVGGEGNFSRCLNYAHGTYTCVFHSDDVYAPTMVEKQVRYLERHPGAGAVFTCAAYIDENGCLIGDAPTPREILASDGEREFCFADIYPLILRDMNFFVCPSAMVRTDIYQQHVVSWSGDRFASSTDLWVWLRILEKYPIGILPERLISYRVSSSQGGAQLRYLKTARADFFSVTDYYNNFPWVQEQLVPRDYRNLAFLETVDCYTRAVNALICEETALARELTKGFLAPSLLRSAVNPDSPRMFGTHRLRYWVYFIIFWFLSRMPGNNLISQLLHLLRYGRRLHAQLAKGQS